MALGNAKCTCVRCGNVFYTGGHNHKNKIKSCSKCTRLFPDNIVDDLAIKMLHEVEDELE